MTNQGARYAKRFERLLGMYPREGGKQWRGVEIERATDGFVSSSYVTALKKGRIHRPGLDKLRAIADIMGFPFELWLQDLEGWDKTPIDEEGHVGGRAFAERLNYLFEVIENDDTGKPFTNREVSRLSRGRVTEVEIEKMRSGALGDPTRSQLLALCDVFDVEFSYWDERREPSLMSGETMEALSNAGSYAILHKSHGLADDDKDLIMVMMEELERRRSKDEEDKGAG